MDLIFTFIIALIAGVVSVIMVEGVSWYHRYRERSKFKGFIGIRIMSMMSILERPLRDNKNEKLSDVLQVERQVLLASYISQLKSLIIPNYNQLALKEYDEIIYLLNWVEKAANHAIQTGVLLDSGYYRGLATAFKKMKWLNIPKEGFDFKENGQIDSHLESFNNAWFKT